MPPRLIPGLFAEPLRQRWLAITRRKQLSQAWSPGRQGSGYEKLDLLAAGLEGRLGPAQHFVTEQIAAVRDKLGVDSSKGWDAYLLRYRTGAFVPEHRDPTTTLSHLRLNVLLLGASEGTGVLRLGGDVIPLAAGDAVLFRPDLQPHEVTRVEGERYVLSVGCVFDQGEAASR